MKRRLKLLLFLLPILFEAISEGLELRGLKLWGKQVEVLEVISWFSVIWMVWKDARLYNANIIYSVIRKFWILPTIYILLRIIFFNYIHNLAAGLPLGYLGEVSIIDRIVAIISFGKWWMIGIYQSVCAAFMWLILKNRL